MQTFNPGTQEAEKGGVCEIEASLVSKASSRTVRVVIDQPCLKNQKGKKRKTGQIPFGHILCCLWDEFTTKAT